MATILAIGIATLDIVNLVDEYPEEDSEIRAVSQRQSRGGNATNTLVVLSQLGHDCHWAGVLIDEPDSAIIQHELNQFNIDTSACTLLTTGKMPTSYISISQQSGSRSIVHHRDCPEFSFNDFKKIDLSQFDWVHFEGRNIEQTQLMLQHLTKHHPSLKCSLEVEKPRQGIEALFRYADLLLFSRDYAQSKNYKTAEQLLKRIAKNGGVRSCTWGEQGAWAMDTDGTLLHSEASYPEKVIDTLGAGDTFNAALIHSLVEKQSLEQALSHACQLAGTKCGQQGLNQLFKYTSNAMPHHFLCHKHALVEGKPLGFSLDIDEKKLDLFLVMHDGVISAYQNHCPHLGIPLNWQPNDFLSLEKTHIQCATHGALFRLDDGYCVAGPCAGDNLSSLTLTQRDDDEIWLVLS